MAPSQQLRRKWLICVIKCHCLGSIPKNVSGHIPSHQGHAQAKTCRSILSDHWGKIFEIFWVVLEYSGLTTDFKFLVPRAKLNCAGHVVCVCAHCSCLSNAANTEFGIICSRNMGTSTTLPAGKVQIKEIIFHLRVIYFVAWF